MNKKILKKRVQKFDIDPQKNYEYTKDIEYEKLIDSVKQIKDLYFK